MVSVQHNFPSLAGEDSADIQHWLAALSGVYPPAEISLLRQACEFAAPLYHGQVEVTGTPLLQHALGSASILVGMHMDQETIAAAVLHAVPDYIEGWAEVLTGLFGRNVASLVSGISRMERIRLFSEARSAKDKDEAAQQIESLRKMLLAMVEDIRVVLIKLAERTQALRSLSGARAEQQKQIAQETQNIFAPLANRLGVWQLKWELEDLSVRYLEPALYKKVAKLLDERRMDREHYISKVIAQLKQALAGAGIEAEVTGRPKHIYSIINKMKRKQVEFGELYDVRAVRILVGGMARQHTKNRQSADETTNRFTRLSNDDNQVSGYTPQTECGAGAEAPEAGIPPSAASRSRLLRSNVSEADDIRNCYAALSVVHELWPPIANEFDDYIANPKGNGYRSLHTAVTGPRQLALEVQIRTHEMHHDSELGVAAHWRYKENKKTDTGFDDKIAWLRQILEWKAELTDSGSLQGQFKNELLQDRVYVFTPLGKVMDLPKGATPVDFAYTLHTDLGHRTRGAKVDGNIVPLKYPLRNGQCVEILTAKQGAPSRDWLSPQLGYLKSARARAKVRHWFKTQNMDDSIAQGKILLERELQRLGVSTINQEKVAQRLHFHKLEELLVALGRGEITSRRVGLAVQQEAPAKQATATQAVAHKHIAQRTSSTDVLIEGVNNLMIKLAKCCRPEKPDAIIGYVTRDRGITIHRQGCAFMQHLPEGKLDRMLNAAWVRE